MNAHKHAAVIAQFAELAQRVEHPETWVECRAPNGEWCRYLKGEAPMFLSRLEYRISDPDGHYVEINGERLEGPMRKAPEAGNEYWMLFGPETAMIWSVSIIDELNLYLGHCFRTEEARDAMRAALTKLLTGD